MSRMYGEQHRALQDQFGVRRLADRIEDVVVVTEINEETKAFIEARDMFFLSTVDHLGRPTVSYKGGAPGFVRVVDDKTLAFPSYNGNAMFLSMGNIAGNSQVGLLFIDFEKPHRMRVQGSARVSNGDQLVGNWKEAELAVVVTVSEVFQNCPRYVHRYQKVKESRYVPNDACDTPVAGWKRIDNLQDVLRARDREAVERDGGPITAEEWVSRLQSGDENA